MLLKNDSGHHCPKVRLKSQEQTLALASAFSFADPVTGGADRDRTDDPLLAKQVLSQLSYSPPRLKATILATAKVVGLDGFEPSTPALSRRCSNQLSYRPDSWSTPHEQPISVSTWSADVGEAITGCGSSLTLVRSLAP